MNSQGAAKRAETVSSPTIMQMWRTYSELVNLDIEEPTDKPAKSRSSWTRANAFIEARSGSGGKAFYDATALDWFFSRNISSSDDTASDSQRTISDHVGSADDLGLVNENGGEVECPHAITADSKAATPPRVVGGNPLVIMDEAIQGSPLCSPTAEEQSTSCREQQNSPRQPPTPRSRSSSGVKYIIGKCVDVEEDAARKCATLPSLKSLGSAAPEVKRRECVGNITRAFGDENVQISVEAPGVTECDERHSSEAAGAAKAGGSPMGKVGVELRPSAPVIEEGDANAEQAPAAVTAAALQKAHRNVFGKRQEEIRRAIYSIPLKRELAAAEVVETVARETASPGSDPSAGEGGGASLATHATPSNHAILPCSAVNAPDGHEADKGEEAEELSARYYRELKRWASGPGGVPRYIKVAMAPSAVGHTASGAATTASGTGSSWNGVPSMEPTAVADTADLPDSSADASVSSPLGLTPALAALARTCLSGTNPARDTVSIRRRRRARRRERERNRRVRIKLASESSVQGATDEVIVVTGNDGQWAIVSTRSVSGEDSMSSSSGTVYTGGVIPGAKRIGRGFNFPSESPQQRKSDLPAMRTETVAKRGPLLALFREGTPASPMHSSSTLTGRHSGDSLHLPPLEVKRDGDAVGRAEATASHGGGAASRVPSLMPSPLHPSAERTPPCTPVIVRSPLPDSNVLPTVASSHLPPQRPRKSVPGAGDPPVLLPAARATVRGTDARPPERLANASAEKLAAAEPGLAEGPVPQKRERHTSDGGPLDSEKNGFRWRLLALVQKHGHRGASSMDADAVTHPPSATATCATLRADEVAVKRIPPSVPHQSPKLKTKLPQLYPSPRPRMSPLEGELPPRVRRSDSMPLQSGKASISRREQAERTHQTHQTSAAALGTTGGVRPSNTFLRTSGKH